MEGKKNDRENLISLIKGRKREKSKENQRHKINESNYISNYNNHEWIQITKLIVKVSATNYLEKRDLKYEKEKLKVEKERKDIPDNY